MAKQTTAREIRAQRILDANGVTIRNLVDRTFDVASERDPEKTYRVNLKNNNCECKDANPLFDVAGQIVKEAHVCKHQIAAQIFEQRITEQKRIASAPRTFKNYDALFAALA